jgi:hypothetical protein
MSILFAANMPAGLKTPPVANNSSLSPNIGNTDFDGGNTMWSPQGIRAAASNNIQEIELLSPETAFWLGANLYTLNTGSVSYCVFANGGTDAFCLYNHNGLLQLRSWNGSAWEVISGQVSTRFNVNIIGGQLGLATHAARYDFDINIHTTSGHIRVYKGNVLILSFEGNTVFNSVTSINQIKFMYHGSSTTAFSEFLVSTKRTIGLRCYSATINGAGASTTFSTGTFAGVDEESVVIATIDGDFAESNSTDQVLGLALDSLINTAYGVHAISVNFRSLFSAGAPEKANPFLRVSGTNYHGPDKTLDTAYGPNYHVWNSNPNGSVSWQVDDIAPLEAGIRSRT